VATIKHPEASQHSARIQDLAASGALAEVLRTATDAERRSLREGAYTIIAPLVFQRLTRRIEISRGHYGCASSLRQLEPDCLDRYHDDVEAVIDDFFRRAVMPITNLSGWLIRRLTVATVDAHRRRRGASGALQRPRLPNWLAEALGGDPWLSELAILMLTWVGVPATAGTELWPLGSWAERRRRATGDRSHDERAIARDIEVVLIAMRRRRTWFTKYIDRPIGHKQPPLPTRDDAEMLRPLHLTDRHAADEARLRELASVAITEIERRLADGGDLRTVVIDVVHVVFGTTDDAAEMDLLPGEESPGATAADLVADPATVTRIVRTVLDLFGHRD
jgi:hypothetical protein